MKKFWTSGDLEKVIPFFFLGFRPWVRAAQPPSRLLYRLFTAKVNFFVPAVEVVEIPLIFLGIVPFADSNKKRVRSRHSWIESPPHLENFH
jgi:hypothetical protein